LFKESGGGKKANPEQRKKKNDCVLSRRGKKEKFFGRIKRKNPLSPWVRDFLIN